MCARQEGTPAGAHALERLCQTYWPPLYAYVRRSGHSPPDAQDLTQSFFERLLTEGRFGFAERGKGRFRTFLLSSLKHFMVNEWRRSTRIKRGSGLAHVPIDCSAEEDAYVHEPIDRASPEAVYERRWATRLLEEVITALRRDYERTGQGLLFDSILPVMWGIPMEAPIRKSPTASERPKVRSRSRFIASVPDSGSGSGMRSRQQSRTHSTPTRSIRSWNTCSMCCSTWSEPRTDNR